jgi:hypothetical protein
VITWSGVGLDVRGQVRRDQLRYRHDAHTSLGLRQPEREAAAVALVQLPGNPDGSGLGVDVETPQRRQLTPPQAGGGGEQTRTR